VLEITGLTRGYGQHPVISDLTLNVPRGQLAALTGPSGCGKSTLIRCIAGLLRPDCGQVRIDGTPVSGVPARLAVVFQDYSRSLYPWLSVRDNVALPLRRTTGSRTARRAAAGAALDSVGLADAAGRYPWQLSGGMQQRAAIARALAAGPVLLLMDEPFGSVDAQTRAGLQDLLLQVRRQRDLTTVLVTHDIDEAVYVADRVLVLTASPGRLRADLTVDLPAPRDQVTTREHPAFTRLRSQALRLIRTRPGPARVTGPATRYQHQQRSHEPDLRDLEHPVRSFCFVSVSRLARGGAGLDVVSAGPADLPWPEALLMVAGIPYPVRFYSTWLPDGSKTWQQQYAGLLAGRVSALARAGGELAFAGGNWNCLAPADNYTQAQLRRMPERSHLAAIDTWWDDTLEPVLDVHNVLDEAGLADVAAIVPLRHRYPPDLRPTGRGGRTCRAYATRNLAKAVGSYRQDRSKTGDVLLVMTISLAQARIRLNGPRK
jgi:NitT/TauT family transport system ATP-binding protein